MPTEPANKAFLPAKANSRIDRSTTLSSKAPHGNAGRYGSSLPAPPGGIWDSAAPAAPRSQRMGALVALESPGRSSLPRFGGRVGLHIDLFEACSAFTHVAACTLAQSPYFVTAIRGLQTFRHLHACPGCFRLERSPGGPCTHWKSAALSRRTWKLDLSKVSHIPAET